MNSSSGTLQDNTTLFFFIILYIPFNIVFMVVAAILFSVINKMLHLHFPTWVLAIAAALLVFVMMFAFLEDSSSKGSDDSALFYSTTLIINSLIVVLMLTLTGVNKLIFKNPSSIPFAFERPQLITTIIYLLITSGFALIPVVSAGSDYLDDMQSENQLLALQEMINTDNVADFTEANENTRELWKVRLVNEQRSLLEYLIAQNKTAMVHVLTKNNKDLFTYTFKWEIKSPAMVQLLIDDGMNPNQVVEALTAYNNAELVKFTVEKYHPTFTSLVSYIVKNVIQNNNMDLLDYLIKNGLTKDLGQSHETIYWFVQSGDIQTTKILLEKGFHMDTSDNRLIYLAIEHSNLPLLKFLFTYSFDVNITYDDYTNLENAIISGNDAIFDFLLTQKPVVNKLHLTKLNGETNAFLIAEKYKRTAMLEKLKRYAAQN